MHEEDRNEAASVDTMQFVLDAARYALRIDHVREVVRAASIARLPSAPPVIEGVLDVRGALIPALDLRQRFGHAPKVLWPDQYFIVAQAGARAVALRVDAAPLLLEIPDDAIDDPQSVTSVVGGYIAGVARLPDGVVLIHDPATFLSQSEAESLEQAMAKARDGGSR